MEKNIINNWNEWVNLKVTKHSDKPFKSGKKIGIITELTVNPFSGKQAFKMDDDSIVDCYQVKLLN
jgi:hypothetical protein